MRWGGRPSPRGLSWSLTLALFLGLLCAYPLRPAPLMPLSPMTEDAFYLLTVARNLAAGLGISYDGTTPTNGIQPAAAFAYAPAFLLAPHGSPILPLRLVQLLQIALFVGGAVLCGRIAQEMSHGAPARSSRRAGILLWLGSYAVFKHAVNGLETGLYLFVLQSWLLWQLRRDAAVSRPRIALLSGLALGLAVLVRIDAVFFVAGACLTQLLSTRDGASLWRRAAGAAALGFGALVVSAPWWIRSYVLFGDLMPSSGRAESLTIGGLANLQRLVPALTHGLLPVLPPVSMRFSWGPATITLVAAALAWLALLGVARADAEGGRIFRPHRTLVGFTAAGTGLAFYYTAFFGAPHFVERYLIPIAVMVVPMTAVIAQRAFAALAHRPAARGLLWVAAVTIFGATAAEHVVTLSASPRISGNPFLADQVERLAATVPRDASLGACQSGTLGYFRPGTVNLDGKVNSEALRARARGELWRYVRSRRLDYLADWPACIDLALGPAPVRGDYVKRAEAGPFQLWQRRSDIAAPGPTPRNRR